nr:MAG TPA: hypothetical protein [Caudoviricetes sp.]
MAFNEIRKKRGANDPQSDHIPVICCGWLCFCVSVSL